ncbi:2-(1,2-epoxy-1,2-dihydrophenyl)acetyl-CoA isomerase [Halogranum amylolyticum]|uniref:2-(1,2-epoxy-1,2-dihydrophenyl)acetyl-CoA isomerase n=1 Tax=Halogranum amylolyticum TaxID=660520 RepID=A0A1H8TAQ5_9EURY|nr:enoyl-CoA hydratase-related protein [Halogranum amylolyticum]SEO87588.1 2-(1,2-epoxy-1,2-dihydrophenyl)acetyl-CoA isomerase [Halogranum amylolyticum]
MRISDEDGVRRVTFDRPDARNAMTTTVAAELADAIEALDPDTHDVCVVTGKGHAFSAGGDVQMMADRDWNAEESYEVMTTTFGRVAEAAIESSVPIVAKVNGDAVGAGMAVVAVSDFAVAVDSARFGAAFVKVGLVPDTGGTFLLPQLLGLRTAKDLAITGRLVDADEAAKMDIVNRTVAAEELDAAVDDLVETLQKRPTRTIGLIKEGIHGNAGRGWQDALDREAMLQARAYDTPEHEEGVSAFLEKREPEF